MDRFQFRLRHPALAHAPLVAHQNDMPELRRPFPEAFPNAGQESELVPGTDIISRKPAVDHAVAVQEKGVRAGSEDSVRCF